MDCGNIDQSKSQFPLLSADSPQPSSGFHLASQDEYNSLGLGVEPDQIPFTTDGRLQGQDLPLSLTTYNMHQTQTNNYIMCNRNGSEMETNSLHVPPQHFREAANRHYLNYDASQHSENLESLNTLDCSLEQNNTERQPFANTFLTAQGINDSWCSFPNAFDGTILCGPQIENPVLSGLNAVNRDNFNPVLDTAAQTIVSTIGNDSLPSFGAYDQTGYLDSTLRADSSWPIDFNFLEDFSANFQTGDILLSTVDPGSFIPEEINTQRFPESSASEPFHNSPLRNPPPFQDFNSFTKCKEFDVAASSTVHDIGATPSVTTDISSVAFGPSRSVSLPPARRGGRKGPLSVQELEKRRKARKQGVCIRCRSMKEKCYGGFPCRPCLENSKATLWIYPCSKACFLDIIESGSYFAGVASAQKYKIEIVNTESFVLQLKTTLVMLALGQPTLVITHFEKILRLPFIINWAAGTQILIEVLKNTHDSRKTMITGKDFLEAPYRLAKAKLPQPLIRFVNPITCKTQEGWLELWLLFCRATKFQIEPEDYHISRLATELGDSADATALFDRTVKTFIWLAQRHYEITIFQDLQNAANELNTLPVEKLSKAAENLLEVLLFGNLNGFAVEDDEFYNEEEDTYNVSQTYLDQKGRIRMSLFVYFCIALDKLPAWSNFWQNFQRGPNQASPDISRCLESNLHAFDVQYESEIARARTFLCRSPEGKLVSKQTQEQASMDQSSAQTPDINSKLQRLCGIFRGPRQPRSELVAIIQRVTEYYLPNLEAVTDLIDEDVLRQPSTSSEGPFIRAVRFLIVKGRDIREQLEEFLKSRPVFEKEPEACQIAESLIKDAFQFMAYADGVLHTVSTVIDRVSNRE